MSLAAGSILVSPPVSSPRDPVGDVVTQRIEHPRLGHRLGSTEEFPKPAVLFKRTPQHPFEFVPGSLPRARIPPDVDLEVIASWGVAQLSQLKAETFAEEALWRDLYALAGLPRTFFGAKQILTAWNELKSIHCPSGFALTPGTPSIVQLGPEHAWVTARYTFTTSGQPAALCSGQVGLIPGPDDGWKIWHFSTILEQLEGYPSPDHFPEEATSNSNGSVQKSSEYVCCVVGAGFAGLCLSARLKALGVRYVTLEKNERVGDNWRNRYRSATCELLLLRLPRSANNLVVHTARDFSDFPLDRMFGDDDPYFLNVKHLARGYEHYAKKHDLNIWTKSILKRATYSTDQKLWLLTVSQGSAEIQIKTKHFVLAIGGAGQTPVMPLLPGREQFKGLAMHSAEYVSSDDWRGKRGIVVGTANTGHDIAEDMLKAELSSITMIQRGRTDVFAVEVHQNFVNRRYNKHIPIEESDRGVMGYPNSIIRQMQLHAHELHDSHEPDKFDALEKAGFKVGRHGDLWKIICGRQGGHIVDVGTSKKIAAGLIKVKNGSLVGFTPSGLQFHDGTAVDADVVVFCTGFANDVRSQASGLVGPEIGELLEDYFHVDDEGEILGAWKPQGHPGIWYTGGGVHFGRFFSRFVALQILADSLGTPLRTYKKKLR